MNRYASPKGGGKNEDKRDSNYADIKLPFGQVK